MLLKPNNSNTSTHDNCGICKKRIYKHNVAIPCHLDGKLYHAKCLKIDSSTALEVQQYGSWYCPICLEDVLPFFKDTSNTYNTPLKTCHCCSKFISQSRHSIIVEGFWVIKCHHVGNVRKRPISSGSGQ